MKALSKQLGQPSIHITLLFGEEQYTKAEADYRKADSEEDRCGTCQHMDEDSHCELVSGHIDPGMVCDYVEPMKEEDASSGE